MPEPHILIDGVGAVYETSGARLVALSDVSLSIGRGEFVSIIGPSGCGKSTLLRLVGGLQTPEAGSILIDGRPPREAQSAKQIGVVFQDASLLPWRNVLDNVRLPLQVNRGRADVQTRRRGRTANPAVRPEFVEGRDLTHSPFDRLRANGEDSPGAVDVRDVGAGLAPALSGDLPAAHTTNGVAPTRPTPKPPTARRAPARGAPTARDPERLIELVGLDAFRDYYPHQLSGGMQQRVALARSLVTSPSVLLMDEPFGALDEITRSAMRYELLRVWRSEAAERGCTVLFVTHSIAEAVLLSDRVVVLTPQPGRIASVLDIDLPRPRDEEIETSPVFFEHTGRLRALLRERNLA